MAAKGEPPRSFSQLLAVVLFVLSAVSLVTAVVLPFSRLTQTDAVVRLNVAPLESHLVLETAPGLPEGVALAPTSEEGLTVDAVANPDVSDEVPPAGLRLLGALGTSVWGLALALIAFLLGRIVFTVGRGDPFNPANPVRFIAMSLTVIIGSLAADTLNWLAASAFYDHYSLQPPLEVVAYYSWTPILLGALVLILAEAFRSGRHLARDTEGLV